MPRVNWAVLLIGTIAVLMLVGFLIWYGTFIYSILRKPNHSIGMSDSSRLGVTYFEDIRTGRRANAYQSMSTAYRASMTPEKFSDFLDEYTLLNSHAFVRQGEIFGSAADPDTPLTAVRIRYTLMPARMPADDESNDAAKTDPKTNRRKLDLTLHFIEENGNWVVDQITFP